MSFPASEQSNDKHVLTTAMWSQGHLVFSPLSPPPPNHISLSPHFLFPRGSKWGQIFPFLLCDLIRAMTLVAAYRAGRRFLTKSSLLHNASSFIFPFIPLPNNVFWCCHVWASRGMCIQMWIRMSLNLQAARICRLSTVWFTRTSS